MKPEFIEKWLKHLQQVPHSRRVWLKRGLFTGGVFLLGSVGYRKAEAEGLVHKGYSKLREALKNKPAHKPTVIAANHSNEPIPNEAEYRAFLKELNLRYIGAEEIIRPHRNYRNGIQNNIPPKSLWNNIIPTLRLADKLRLNLGVRVSVLSIYRSPDYNSAINGASRSQHMQNIAIDLKFDCDSDRAFELAKKFREEGEFSGGIGWYPSFIHIDTRGYDATWGKV